MARHSTKLAVVTVTFQSLLTALLTGAQTQATEPPAEGVLRVATYNVSMYRDRAGQLSKELESGNSSQAKQIAEVLQRVRPHIVLLNEFDYSPQQVAGEVPLLPHVFARRYLQASQSGLAAIKYGFAFYEPVNTGVNSGLDLDRDAQLGGPADAWGFGHYPGQYGMLLYSQLPIVVAESAAFQKLKWRDLPEPNFPSDPQAAAPYYDDETIQSFRLPSKSFWDVVVRLPGDSNRTLHLLCSHPTPPVFDGPEDRNGLRNYDEIRMVAHYISQRGKSPYVENHSGELHGLPADASFVVLGDLNADPVDGGGRPGAIQQLLKHPAVNASFVPESLGGRAASEAKPELNARQKGNPAHDTADFGGDGYGNLRVDYVLPSTDLEVVGSGIFWPKEGEPGAEAIKATDHRLVWIDIQL